VSFIVAVYAPLVALARLLFGKLPVCALVGGMVGASGGALLGMYMVDADPAVWPDAARVWAALLLAAVGAALAILLLVGAERRPATVIPPILVNAVLTSLANVYLNILVHVPGLALLVGWLAGVLVGLLLCWIWCGFGLSAGSGKR